MFYHLVQNVLGAFVFFFSPEAPSYFLSLQCCVDLDFFSLNVECVQATQHSAHSHPWATAVQMSLILTQPLEEHLGSIPSFVLLSAEGTRGDYNTAVQ